MPAIDANLAIAITTVLAAGVMRGFSGFGAAMLIVPVLSLIYGPPIAVAVMLVMEVPALIQMLPETARHTAWRSVLTMAIPAMIVTPIGAYSLIVLDPDLMRRGIGLVVVMFVVVLAFGWRYHRQPGMAITISTGVISGFFGAAMGIGGPPVILYFLSGQFSAREVRANITGYWSLRLIAISAAYYWFGLLTIELIVLALILTPPYAVAIWAGSRLFRHASETLFRRVAFAVVGTIGVIALVA
jgi:uncharacterized protein